MPRIVVVGSLNMDLVVRTPHLPRLGETILGRDFMTAPGGRGANQTVAAATGIAIIEVEDSGQNTIVVAPGANAQVTRAMLMRPDRSSPLHRPSSRSWRFCWILSGMRWIWLARLRS